MKIKNNFGITLISLVVTIIVMIILAGVSISLSINDNNDGLINKSKKQIDDQKKLSDQLSSDTNETLKQQKEDWGF